MAKSAFRQPVAVRSRIILVEDHPLVRAQLEQVINAETDLVICGVAVERHAALCLIRSNKPDLVVTELLLENSSGLDLVKDLQVQHPGILTLIISSADETIHAERVMRAGARGYVSTRDSAKILPAIRQVLAGKIYLSQGLIAEFVSRFLNHSSSPKPPTDRLSDQESKVFELIGQGFGTGSIASKMHLVPDTVRTYRARIKEKLQLKGRDALLRNAIQSSNSARSALPA